MQDTQLFLTISEIAGVFVGFGALIAVRSGGASDAYEVGYMRALVSMGLLTVVAALAPVTLGRFDLAEHQVWALSSALILVILLGALAISFGTPEARAAQPDERLPGRIDLMATTLWVLLVIGSLLSLIVIVLGVAPDLEPPLYFTVVVLLLLWAALALLRLVFRQRPPASA